MNTHNDNVRYFESEEYGIWLKLAHNKPPQKDTGYWYYDTTEKVWKFKEGTN